MRRSPDDTRIYVFAGGQHGPAAFPPRRSIGQQLNNPNDYRWSMRALLLAMNRWIKDGVAPPPSRHPRIDDKTLVQLESLKFPSRSQASAKPTEAHKAYRVFYGLDFASKGIISVDPPEANGVVSDPRSSGGQRRQRARRREDAGDLSAAGHLHRLESLQRRIGADYSAVEHAGLLHSSASHARRSRARRKIRGRRSKSATESREHYLALVTAAARELVQQGYLLEEDVNKLVERADSHWSRAVASAETIGR